MSDQKTDKKYQKHLDFMKEDKNKSVVEAAYAREKNRAAREKVGGLMWVFYGTIIALVIFMILMVVFNMDFLFNYKWNDSENVWYIDNDGKTETVEVLEPTRNINIWKIVGDVLMIIAGIVIIVFIILYGQAGNCALYGITYVIFVILWCIMSMYIDIRTNSLIKHLIPPEQNTTSTFTNKISETFSNITKKLRKY